MKPLTTEWLVKVENDFCSAQREWRVRKHPNHDLTCFLSQQCVEKYLKARLVEAGIAFPKTHDLEELLDLAQPVEPHLERYRSRLASLTDHAFEFRYPGETATKEVAGVAFATCHVVRQAVRRCLGLDEPPSAQMKLQIREKRAPYQGRRRK